MLNANVKHSSLKKYRLIIARTFSKYHKTATKSCIFDLFLITKTWLNDKEVNQRVCDRVFQKHIFSKSFIIATKSWLLWKVFFHYENLAELQES